MNLKAEGQINSFSVILVLALLSSGIIGKGEAHRGQQQASESTRKISPFAFLNETHEAALVVDVELARMRKSEAYIPLMVWLAKKSLYSLAIDRSSFLFVDSDGNVTSMAEPREVRAGYSQYDLDAQFYVQKISAGGTLLTAFSFFEELQCRFFPHPLRHKFRVDTLVDNVTLRQKSFLADLIYFPRQKEIVSGQGFRLRVESDGLEEPLEVAFNLD